MNLTSHGVPDVPLLGRYSYTHAHPALAEHTHRNAVEICYLEKGHQTYLLGDRLYRLQGGDLFIAAANRPHSTGGEPEEKGVLYWIVLRLPQAGGRILGLPSKISHEIVKALGKFESPHFRGSLAVKDHLDAITTLFHERHDPLKDFAIMNRFRDCLLEIIDCANSHPKSNNKRSMQSTCEYIRKNVEAPLSIQMLAKRERCSLPHFKARFKREIGIPPAEYILRERVAEAQRCLLRPGSSITEVAYQLGFSSSQYFATVFKRFTGNTPSSFQRQVRPGVVG